MTITSEQQNSNPVPSTRTAERPSFLYTTGAAYSMSRDFYAEYAELMPEGYGLVAPGGITAAHGLFPDTATFAWNSLLFDARQHEESAYDWYFNVPSGAGRLAIRLSASPSATIAREAYYDHQGRRSYVYEMNDRDTAKVGLIIKDMLALPESSTYRLLKKEAKREGNALAENPPANASPREIKNIKARAQVIGFVALAPQQF